MAADIRHVGNHYELYIDGVFHSSHDTSYDASEEYEEYIAENGGKDNGKGSSFRRN